MAPRSLTALFYWLGAVGLVLSLVLPLLHLGRLDGGMELLHLVSLFTAALLVIAAGRVIALLEQIARSVRHPRPPDEVVPSGARGSARPARSPAGMPQTPAGLPQTSELGTRVA